MAVWHPRIERDCSKHRVDCFDDVTAAPVASRASQGNNGVASIPHGASHCRKTGTSSIQNLGPSDVLRFTGATSARKVVLMFRESIRRFVDSTEGAQAGLLMDFEGITVEAYSRDDSVCDIETVGAEASVVVKSIQRAGEMLDVGQMREISFQSDKLTTLIRILNDNYFVALTLGPGGNFGKARYVLRAAAPALASELV
jgi:predicted regulator of Ras-like GTPase activity (Roadblock/LC7/MglB family)